MCRGSSRPTIPTSPTLPYRNSGWRLHLWASRFVVEAGFQRMAHLAITQAICLYRKRQKIAGPLYMGIDTHALSVPACATALEVLAANGVEVMLAEGDEYTRPR